MLNFIWVCLTIASFATRYLGAQKAYITIRKDVINNFSGQKKVLINTLKEVIQEMPNSPINVSNACTYTELVTY